MSFVAVFAQVQAAADDATTHWLTLVSLTVVILGGLLGLWAKAIRPMMKAIGQLLEDRDAQREEREWVRQQITNGDDSSIREALDENSEETRVAAAAAKAGFEKAALLGAKLSEHLDWSAEFATQANKRLEDLERRDTRSPRLEPGDDD